MKKTLLFEPDKTGVSAPSHSPHFWINTYNILLLRVTARAR